MALSANSVFEVRTAGNDTNGGGFVTGASGTDYSQTDSARTGTGSNDSTTDAVAVGTGVITSATAAFTSAIVGNIIHLSGGTGALAAGSYQVTVFTSATSITVDRNVAAGTGITMNIGGALLSPAIPVARSVSDNLIYIKTGTYAITSTTAGVAGGRVLGVVRCAIEGYNTTRGDLGTPPLLQASGISTTTLVTLVSTERIVNVNVDGASLTSIRGIHLTANNIAYKCSALNCTNSGFFISTGCSTFFCTATGCATAAAFLTAGSGNMLLGCEAYSNTITGFSLGGTHSAVNRCLAYDNSGASTDGFLISSATPSSFVNCVAYDNGRSGFRAQFITDPVYINCISEANTALGFDLTTSPNAVLSNCAGFNNTSGNVTASGANAKNLNFVTGSASFFTSPGSGDFSLNTTAGGGAAARAAGFLGVFPAGTSTGYLDIGAVQHQDTPSTNLFTILD